MCRGQRCQEPGKEKVSGTDNLAYVLRAELWSHFWPNCDGRDLGLFFGVLAELL